MNNEKKHTREEIVRSLRWCDTGTEDGCDNCTFEPKCDEDAVTCVSHLCGAAADLIDELTDRCARYAEEIMELRQVNDLSGASRHLPLKGEARADRVVGPYEATADGPCVGADDPVRPNDDRNSRDSAG